MNCFLLIVIVAAIVADIAEARPILPKDFAKNVVKDNLKWPKGIVFYEYSNSIRKLITFYKKKKD